MEAADRTSELMKELNFEPEDLEGLESLAKERAWSVEYLLEHLLKVWQKYQQNGIFCADDVLEDENIVISGDH